jgi:anti-anti-sigma factor
MADTLNFSLREIESVKIVDLRGNLTVNTNRLFENLIDKISEKESLIINMQNVSMVTSAGMESLVEVSQRAKKMEHRIVLLWAGTDVKKVSESLNIYHLLIFAESPEEGVTKIRYYT